jgi:hypothetical protein
MAPLFADGFGMNDWITQLFQFRFAPLWSVLGGGISLGLFISTF